MGAWSRAGWIGVSSLYFDRGFELSSEGYMGEDDDDWTVGKDEWKVRREGEGKGDTRSVSGFWVL